MIEIERASKRSPQLLLTLVALAFAAAAIWAATALANSPSSSASNDPSSSRPAAELVQSRDDPAPSEDDCPADEGGGGGGSDGSSGSAGTSPSDF